MILKCLFLIFILINIALSVKCCNQKSDKRIKREGDTMTEKPRIFVRNEELPSDKIDILAKRCDVIFGKESENATALANKIKCAGGVNAIIWHGHIPINEDILQAAGPKCKLIAAVSAGFDNYDMNLLNKYEIKLTNTPKVLSNAVADVAIYLMLAASRRAEESRRKLVDGKWETGFQWLLGKDISGSTVGIAGLGGIGAAIAKRLSVFDVEKILYSGRKPKPYDKELNAQFVPFETLLKESDFVIASLPLTNGTRDIFNKTSFALMKKSAVFVNIARGGLVNTADLVDALKTNTIFAAGLDVMNPEPLPVDHELIKLPNCVLLPHIGSATEKTRGAMAELAIKNVFAYLDDKPLLTPVN